MALYRGVLIDTLGRLIAGNEYLLLSYVDALATKYFNVGNYEEFLNKVRGEVQEQFGDKFKISVYDFDNEEEVQDIELSSEIRFCLSLSANNPPNYYSITIN